MIQKLSPRDWELLSAYLDRQLKPNEKSALEARLSTDPELSAALGDLQRTRDALRSLPRLRAPRNFTLTPQMVGQRSAWRSRPVARLAPVFGFASALATFLLILVVVGDLLGVLAPSTVPVSQAPIMVTEAPSQPLFQQASPQEMTPTVEITEAPMTLSAEALPTGTPEPTESLQQINPEVNETNPVSSSLSAMAPDIPIEETPAMTETMVEPLATSPKQPAGMGGGGPSETGNGLLASESILTPDGPMWIATVLVTVTPTETLTFPMTITLDRATITSTLDVAAENGLPFEPTLDTEVAPTQTAEPEPQPTATETPLPAPTSTPVEVARVDITPTTAPPEPQTYQPTQLPTRVQPGTVLTPQPSRPGLPVVRLIEVALAFAALGAALVAGIAWWSKHA